MKKNHDITFYKIIVTQNIAQEIIHKLIDGIEEAEGDNGNKISHS